MAEKTLNTRILLKYDSYENWTTKNPVLKAGEVAIATVPSNQDGIQNAPSVLMKVGDGSNPYNSLKFLSGLAADVHTWAKAEKKPTYEAGEITGIGDYIATYVDETLGISVDTDTQYRITKVDDYNYKLQSKAKGEADTAFTDVSTIVIPKYDDTEVKADIEALEGLVGTTAVATQIANTIAALDLANTYEKKGAADEALAEANSYTDGKIAEEVTARETGVNEAKAAAATAQSEVDVLETVVDGKADKATTLAGYGIGDAYTKTEVDSKLSSVYKYKGSVASYDALPTTAEVGDVYNIENAGSVSKTVKLIPVEDVSISYETSYPRNAQLSITFDNSSYPIDETVYSNAANNGGEISLYDENGQFITYLYGTSAMSSLGTGDLWGMFDDPQHNFDVSKVKYFQITNYETNSNATGVDVVSKGLIINAGDNVAWNGTTWDVLAGTVDTSSFATKATTLEGYGITDGATKGELEGMYNGVSTQMGNMETALQGNIDTVSQSVTDLDNSLATVAKTGNVKDLVQTEGDVLIFNCGDSTNCGA